jgi:hypothetical protein
LIKKLFTIFLLALMLFNTAGYRLLFTLLENRASVKLDLAIDSGDYEEASLVEISVPLNMPYQDRFTSFERSYGEITVDGQVYTYVKMKIESNLMILKCLPNSSKQQLRSTYDNLVRTAGNQDIDQNNKKHHPASGWAFSSDYDNNNQFASIPYQCFACLLQIPAYADVLSDVLIKTPHQPPKC